MHLSHSTTGRLVAALLIGSFIAGPLLATDVQAARRRTKAVKSTSSSVEIMSMTRGAQVYVDDKLVGAVPLDGPVTLSPNQPHVIRLRKRGFTTFVDTVRLKVGEARELEADLIPSGGVVTIACNVRRAQVLLDGRAIGRTPFDGDVSPGRHTLQVVAPGKLQDTRVIEVMAGEVTKLDVELKDVPPPTVEKDDSILGAWWFWAAVGATVLGGVTIGVLSAREIDIAAEDRLCEPSCHTITIGN